MYVPLLDDPISPLEVDDVLNKRLKANKGCGPDGVPPGIFKILPITWILFLTSLFNMVFSTIYPQKWYFSRLIVLFKKGLLSSCNNYRGISIMNNIAKIYDYVLEARLSRWFKPDREQAGAQSKRSCTEHILTLRLIMDYCFRKKKKLFVVYVDYSKAYDRVPRRALMEVLRKLGCGAMMLTALISMYQVSKSILGLAVITSLIGVRQGSPTSCLLFTLYVNEFIRMLKERCEPDGFLSWLHVLMYMDDTVILATTREKCEEKVRLLLEFCHKSGMVINIDKTKFMVVNGTLHDRRDLNVWDNVSNTSACLEHVDRYIYLGSVFTAHGKISSDVIQHVKDKRAHFLKLVAFYQKNMDMPFCVKLKVLQAAFMSAIMYGCESWVNVSSIKPVEKLYYGAIKSLLNVRITTCNELCLLD